MGWSKQKHEQELTDAILNQDLDRIQQLADDATQHDRQIAEQTGKIHWDHKHKWAG